MSNWPYAVTRTSLEGSVLVIPTKKGKKLKALKIINLKAISNWRVKSDNKGVVKTATVDVAETSQAVAEFEPSVTQDGAQPHFVPSAPISAGTLKHNSKKKSTKGWPRGN